MITRTFRVVPSVGPVTEKKILSCGIRDWYGFLEADCVPAVSAATKEKCDRHLNVACSLLDRGDTRGLTSMLPRNEEWRLFNRFGGDAAYLDIETDGLYSGARVTMATVHRRGESVTLTRGRDLNARRLADALDDAPMVVTFNGKCFDIPMLASEFPTLDLGMPNLDLRFAGRKAGLDGGLGRVERLLGITREGEMANLDGAEAVRLWNRWERNNDHRSLELLAEYNRADTENLVFLAQEICRRLADGV